MLVAKLSQIINEKVSQRIEKNSGRALGCQGGSFMAQTCSVDAAFPGPVRPNPPAPFRMISYDDMMLAD